MSITDQWAVPCGSLSAWRASVLYAFCMGCFIGSRLTSYMLVPPNHVAKQQCGSYVRLKHGFGNLEVVYEKFWSTRVQGVHPMSAGGVSKRSTSDLSASF
jgi:hypothetical protein